MKRAIIICILTGATLALWFGRRKPPATASASPLQNAAGDLRAVTLVFGQKDKEPTRWDGSAAISAGSIERIAGYHFTKQDSASGTSWKCATTPWPGHPHEMWPSE